MRRLLLQLVLPLLVLSSLGAAPAASAQGVQTPTGVGIFPLPGRYASPSGTFVELGTLVVGKAVTGELVLRNQGDAPERVLLYASDALPAKGGGFGFSDRAATDTQVGSWLTLDRSDVTVPPRGSVRAGYKVVVPSGVAGGEYVGGVVAEAAPDASPAPGVQTVTRAAMAVYLTVPGGRPGATPGRGRPDGTLVIDRVALPTRGGRFCPVVTYRNDSQKVLDPSVRVRTRGPLGSTSATRDRIGAVLPGASADVALPCVNRAIGPGEVTVRLATPEGEVDYAERYLYLPIAAGLALLLLLLLLLALVTTALRGRRRAADAPTPSPS